jgi:hypothetical protein
MMGSAGGNFPKWADATIPAPKATQTTDHLVNVVSDGDVCSGSVNFNVSIRRIIKALKTRQKVLELLGNLWISAAVA